jgi:hypothetical protein
LGKRLGRDKNSKRDKKENHNPLLNNDEKQYGFENIELMEKIFKSEKMKKTLVATDKTPLLQQVWVFRFILKHIK